MGFLYFVRAGRVPQMFHIVDDNYALREMLVDILRELGHAACAYSSALEYIDFMDDADYEQPIAIFTDVKMPGMNGFELIARVQKRYRNMKFVVMSGYTDELSDKMKMACLVLTKPFQMDLLEKMTELLIQCHHGRLGELRCNQVAELKPLYPAGWQCPHQPSCSCI
ncbi:MAG: hypothetical protein CO187_03800 [Zetaproteobacteria bacterium CG_4_9_14_3_um_filter_53_7]|nr:MAG: hypothetical protein CO187_03800 [Zetaproteobacteria bacterium CG_4_9_14_3_um_filter_53_7]